MSVSLRNLAGEDLDALRAQFKALVRAGHNCWHWGGFIDGDGFGRFAFTPRIIEYAHVASWVLTHGDIPDGLVLTQTCGNRICVRPDHLTVSAPLTSREVLRWLFGS